MVNRKQRHTSLWFASLTFAGLTLLAAAADHAIAAGGRSKPSVPPVESRSGGDPISHRFTAQPADNSL